MPTESTKKGVVIVLTVVMACLAPAAVRGILAILDAAVAEKTGGASGKTQDIPVWVLFDTHQPGISSESSISMGDEHRDGESHISAFVSRDQGQFVFDTCANGSPTGCALRFVFPEGTILTNPYPVSPPFPDTDGDGNPHTVKPAGVRMTTAGDRVPIHVDLRDLAKGESGTTALNIILTVDDTQDSWDLSYGDVLWKDGSRYWDDNMDFANLITVTRNADTIDGKRVWTIQSNGGDWAYLRKIVDTGGAWIPVGIFEMPLSLTLVEKPTGQIVTAESSLIKDFVQER